MLVLTTSFGFFSTPAQAGITDQLTQVYQSAKSGGKEALCRKGSFTGAEVSLRSFDGLLCSSSSTIAALSQYACNSVAGFAGSSCDVKGKQTLGGADPKTVLKEKAKSATGATKDLITQFAPGL